MSRVSVMLMLVVAIVSLGFVVVPATAQVPRPDETKAAVPALDAMHEVIMPMWHEAWPNKDYKALAAMVPALDTHMAAIAAAELPGILRDKAPQWKTGVADLQTCVTAFKAAVTAGDNDALLKAAEKLHAQYESLGKIIRPVLKEMEDFHASLYVLYHYQLNPFQPAKAMDTVQTLKVKMDVLNKATLPDRLKAKTDGFTAQRAELSKAVDAAVASLATKDETKIKAAIDTMHGAYEALEQVFK
ncbi:MAG: hypothetical protein NTY02_05700 [Acidobacteria bacterium]|nr:hypothetical protein [Acidobacteriota bacterium]